MKTSELTGAALNWAVAKCQPDDTLSVYFDEDTGEPLCHDDWPDNQEFKPSSDWAQGGPIIEREGINIIQSGSWFAEMDADHSGGVIYAEADTPLVAAMRCYVASKFGDEVELPLDL
jgi:hypothetical protein